MLFTRRDLRSARGDLTVGLASLAMLAVLLTIAAWRPTPDRSDVEVLLYVLAGALEASAIAVTVLDVRAKAKAAADFERPAPRPQDVRHVIRESAAAAQGVVTYGQLERVAQTLLAALRGPWLAVAAGLLLAGVVIGTVANVLSATR